MKTLYIDCGMGAAGDMLTSALLELTDDPDGWVEKLNALGIPHVEFCRENAEKCGIQGTHMCVHVLGRTEDAEHPHEHHHHHHSDMEDIAHIVSHLPVPDKVRRDVLAVYDSIAAAESAVHGVPVTQIHFHEVGDLDAVADVTAVCLLMDALGIEQVVASPVHVGAGQVRCAHGVLPVPAPATAMLLRDIPIYGGAIEGELCTPTGAALLRHFVTRFGELPPMRVKKIGYGMGTKDFPRANCVRVMLGETDSDASDVCVLSCNLDDMTGEDVGFAIERLFSAGALDAYSIPITMKKSRPGVMLQAICRPEDREEILKTVFQNTTTLGVRECRMPRYTLERTSEMRETPYGQVRIKTAAGYGVTRQKWEFDDVRRIALQENISADEARRLLESYKDGNNG
jgi:hypothetical protein